MECKNKRNFNHNQISTLFTTIFEDKELTITALLHFLSLDLCFHLGV